MANVSDASRFVSGNMTALIPPDQPTPIADRIAESGARLILSCFGPAGAILAEAVTFARAIYDDGQVAVAREALEQRLGNLDHRLAALEVRGPVVRITGERAEILVLAVRQANGHTVSYSAAEDGKRELGLSAESYFEALQELDQLGVILNHGFNGVGVPPSVFVELVGQVVPGVLAEREIGEILDVFRRTKNPNWVNREEFEALTIPIARTQHMLEYLEQQQLVHLNGPADSVERLLFLQAQLLPRGKRVLRGDEILG